MENTPEHAMEGGRVASGKSDAQKEQVPGSSSTLQPRPDTSKDHHSLAKYLKAPPDDDPFPFYAKQATSNMAVTYADLDDRMRAHVATLLEDGVKRIQDSERMVLDSPEEEREPVPSLTDPSTKSGISVARDHGLPNERLETTTTSSCSGESFYTADWDKVQSILSPMRQNIVDRVMATFREMFNQHVVFWDEEECESSSTSDDEDWESDEELGDQSPLDQSDASDTGAEEGSTSGTSQSNTASNTTSSTASSGPKGKRRAGDDVNGSSYSNGRQKRLKTVTRADTELGEPPKRLACPFFKKFSPRPPKAASCYFPGFNGVSRVKEHIYREHRIPNRCGRCFQSFASGAALNAHLRAEERCTQLEDDPEIQIITDDQEALLKCKKRAKAPKSEEERWKRVYRILFPQDDETSMPSPYCDYDSNTFSRYESFSRERLPQLVRQALEVAVYRNEEVVEDRLRSQLVEIVQRSQEEMFTQFRRHEWASPVHGPSEEARQDVSAAQQEQDGLGLASEPDLTGVITGTSNAFEHMLAPGELIDDSLLMDDALFQPDAAASNGTENSWGLLGSDQQHGFFEPFASGMGILPGDHPSRSDCTNFFNGWTGIG